MHLLNGTSFGVAYLFLFARDGRTSVRRALLTGVGWGLFLETFQLTLYPGWLDIRLYQEFATISALSHIVYGATLDCSDVPCCGGSSASHRSMSPESGSRPDWLR